MIRFALPSRYPYTVTVIDRRPPLQTVTLPLPYRYLPSLTVLRYRPLPSVTYRYLALPTVTHRYRPLLEKNLESFNILQLFSS